MPRRSNPFQRLVKGIEAGLAPTEASVTESAMVPNEAGEEREVDVLIEAEVGGHPIKLAVEARDHARPQDKTWIDNLLGRYRDLPIDHVIAVSSSGFTSGALKKADRVNIETLTLDEALATDWPEEVFRLTAVFVELKHELKFARPHYVRDSPEVDGETLKGLGIADGDGNVESTFGKDALTLYRENGERVVQEEFNENLEKYAREGPGTVRGIQVKYEAHDRHIVAPDGESYELEAITLAIEWDYYLRPADTTHYEYKESYVTEAKLEDPALGEHSLVIVQRPEDAGERASIHYQSQPADEEAQEPE